MSRRPKVYIEHQLIIIIIIILSKRRYFRDAMSGAQSINAYESINTTIMCYI